MFGLLFPNGEREKPSKSFTSTSTSMLSSFFTNHRRVFARPSQAEPPAPSPSPLKSKDIEESRILSRAKPPAPSPSPLKSKDIEESRILSRAKPPAPPLTSSPDPLKPRDIKEPPIFSASSFLSLPSVADLIRATEHVAPPALRRSTKRHLEPDEEDRSLSTKLTACSPASKRRRTDLCESDPPQGVVVAAPTSPSVASAPSAGEEQPDEILYRTGFEPHAIGIWIAELLNDRFSTSALLENDDSFLTTLFMKQLSNDLIELIHSLNPSNNTIFIGLVYLERLMRNTSLRGMGTQKERLEMMKRTFIMALHLAFTWTDDVPWSLAYICQKMDLTLQKAKRWEIEALTILEYNLAISRATALRWLDALEEHAHDIIFQPNLAQALHGIFEAAREAFWKCGEVKDRARAVASSGSPLPVPRLVTAPPAQPDLGFSRSRSPIFGGDLETMPSSRYIIDIVDEQPALLHRSYNSVDSSRTSWSRTVDSEAWEWYYESDRLFPSLHQPQPVYPPYQLSMLAAVA
ncbi:hypothetical protein E1B28_003067 [Marasmius oreades]|uniref:Uncharacterized protein n=1 Tax=Marasmius oreades TaxID=181124 RepID=A0A9P7RLM8_9AGAR|nr:uncharacterized protein E1B28_003067 [Marasmius oreades]KAG7085506.1 hypothetical protein E1B28_003067 [Marasmius oreades]